MVWKETYRPAWTPLSVRLTQVWTDRQFSPIAPSLSDAPDNHQSQAAVRYWYLTVELFVAFSILGA